MSEEGIQWFADPGYWKEMRRLAWGDRLTECSKPQAEAIFELLGMRGGDSVLDLACGFGRHCLEFDRLGLDVTGVDLNQAFVDEATEKADAERRSIRYIVADMREFREPESYDHVVILYNSFGYFRDPEDDRRVIHNCLESLLPGGSLLISVTGQEVLRHYQVTRKRRGWHERDGLIVLEEYEISEDWNWQRIRWTLLEGVERRTIEYSMRVYSKSSITELLESSGFEDVSVYGGLDGSPYTGESVRLVAVARKPV